jgi:SNF2 family DNA or RNA helicase
MTRYLQLLTGTPINKPLDAFAYIKLKTPGVYRSLSQFENLHVAERDFWKQPVAYANLDLLKSNLAINTISRTKEELHGYSLKAIYPDCEYDLAPEHYALYVKLVEEQLLTFDDGTKIDATTVQRLRHALQQIVVNYDYFANDFSLRSVAYDLIDMTIQQTGCMNTSRSKLIIWTKYKRTSRSVLAYLTKLGCNPVAAYSEVDASKSIDRFLEDSSVRILVAQYQSAGAGLNPQYVCSENLFLELDTVPLYIRQAVGRTERTGQTKVPVMRFAVAKGTVQQTLLASLIKNDDLVQRIEPSKKGLRDALLGIC